MNSRRNNFIASFSDISLTHHQIAHGVFYNKMIEFKQMDIFTHHDYFFCHFESFFLF